MIQWAGKCFFVRNWIHAPFDGLIHVLGTGERCNFSVFLYPFVENGSLEACKGSRSLFKRFLVCGVER